MKRNRKAITAISALSAVFAVSASAQDPSSTGKQTGLTNPGFEEPRLNPEKEYDYFKTMPGWTTTDDQFEIWRSGHEGVAAHEGTQFVELNYLKHGTLYQDSTDIKAGTILEFTFAHRGRKGDDTMRLTITDLGANNVPGGGDDTVLFTDKYITGNAAWKVYKSKKKDPITALGHTIRFAYEAVATSTENLAVGNLLDAANFGVGVLLPTVTSGAKNKEGVYFISGTVDWAGYANPICDETGIVYAPTSANPDPQVGGKNVVMKNAGGGKAAGEVATWIIPVLDIAPDTEYTYKAYSVFDGKTFYSEPQQFKTDKAK